VKLHRSQQITLKPERAKREADIVDVGYVLNVIEDPATA